jgi:hypothetical protein
MPWISKKKLKKYNRPSEVIVNVRIGSNPLAKFVMDGDLLEVATDGILTLDCPVEIIAETSYTPSEYRFKHSGRLNK